MSTSGSTAGSASAASAIDERSPLPAAVPAVVLAGYAYAREHHPEIECLDEVNRLYEKICVALVSDPVLRRMVEQNPDYAALVEAQSAADPLPLTDADAIPPSALITMVGSSPEFRMWFAEWNARFFLVVGPMIRELFERKEFARFVRSLLDTLFGPAHRDKVIASVQAVIEEYVHEDYLEEIDDAVNWLLDYALHPDLPEWVDDVLDWLMKRTLTAKRLPRLQALLNWLLVEFLDSEGLPAHLDFAAEWFVAAARDVAEQFQEGYEDEELGVKDAANWLGISPWTLRTHIRNRRGTPSEVPVRLVTGPGIRGRGRHVIKRSDLFSWARDHWFSEKKKNLPPV